MGRISFKELIGFNTPRAIVINLSAILVFLAAVPTKIISSGPSICVFKNIIIPLFFGWNCPTVGLFAGCACPACGLTRAMSSLLHGDMIGAWNYNGMVFVVFIVMVVLIGINGWKWCRSKKRILHR